MPKEKAPLSYRNKKRRKESTYRRQNDLVSKLEMWHI
jgi:hypothetical protein